MRWVKIKVINAADVFDRAITRLDKLEVRRSSSVFEFEPVSLETFVTDKSYLGLPPLSPIQREAVEYATQIYKPETMKALGWKSIRPTSELVLCWGKGSGKDFVARVMLLRIAYLLLALRNPQGYVYHPDSPCGVERIDMLNTAVNKEQAVNVFFTPLRKYISQSPFFRARAQVLVSEIKFDKGIYLISGHSEAEAQEGLNLIAVVLDEIAAFKTDMEVQDLKRLKIRKNMPQSASSLYDFAKSTVATRFPLGMGKVILLSFPRFKGDFITTKYEEGLKKKHVYVSKHATYEVNPTKKKSDFQEEMDDNLQRYQARIECNPTLAEDAFFKNELAIFRAFKKELPSPIDGYSNRFKSWFICKDNFLRYGHVDLSKNRDLAAIAFCHAPEVITRNTERQEEDGVNRTVQIDIPMVNLDFVMYFKAPHGGEIDYSQILDTILDFTEVRGFPIGLITFDGYQSVYMKQTLEKKGIMVDDLSVDRTRDAYESWQDVLYEGRFTSYYVPYLVEEEIPFLIDFKGKKIEHRQGRSKDGCDAVAGAVHNCIQSNNWSGTQVWAA